MSHYECNRCGGRFRDEHECPADGAMLLDRIRDLEEIVSALQSDIADLRIRLGMTEGMP